MRCARWARGAARDTWGSARHVHSLGAAARALADAGPRRRTCGKRRGSGPVDTRHPQIVPQPAIRIRPGTSRSRARVRAPWPRAAGTAGLRCVTARIQAQEPRAPRPDHPIWSSGRGEHDDHDRASRRRAASTRWKIRTPRVRHHEALPTTRSRRPRRKFLRARANRAQKGYARIRLPEGASAAEFVRRLPRRRADRARGYARSRRRCHDRLRVTSSQTGAVRSHTACQCARGSSTPDR